MADFLFDEGKNKIEGLNKTEINEALNSKADAQAVANAFESVNTALNGKASTQALNEAVQGINTALNGKASVDYVNGELEKKLNVIGDVDVILTPISTIDGYRAICSQNDRAFITVNNGQVVKSYQVSAGKKYTIRSFGYDVKTFDVAVIGKELIGGGQSTELKQVILCGGSTYPTDYTNHVITFVAESDGYLYINERTSTGVESYAKAYETVTVKNESCLIINNGNYKHLSYIGNGRYLNREFTRRGPNSLFQLVHVGIGILTQENLYIEEKSYMTATTDIIGPFSIDKTGWSGGVWTGGNHSVNVNGVACPTAEQLSLKIIVNNIEVTDNGIYWGNIKFVAKNKLYFAQTITGNTFEGATAAILETRVYDMKNSMNVEVYIELLDDVRFSKYYGMQYVNQNVVNVIVPNDETIIDVSNLESNYSMINKQSDIILQYNDNVELHMLLNDSGLGTYAHNAGTDGYGLVATYNKTYHTLISNTSIANGKKLYWSGEYKMIV